MALLVCLGVFVLITLNSVITIAIRFIIPNSYISNCVLLFSCTDKGKVNNPKEELALSAEDGKYLLCLHGSSLFFSIVSVCSRRSIETKNYIVLLDLINFSITEMLLQNFVGLFYS